MIETHRSSSAMARVLVQYIADPHRVRRIVRGEWNDAPDLTTIANMRAKHLRAGPEAISFKREDDKYVLQMEQANEAFLAALGRAGRPIITA